MQYQCSCWFVDCFAEQCADVPRQGSNLSYMQDFCAVLCVPAPIRIPEHSPLARRCRWRLEHARLSVHDARLYNLLYVKSQCYHDTASRLLSILGLEIFDVRMNSLSPDLKSQLPSREEFSCHDAFMPNSRRI